MGETAHWLVIPEPGFQAGQEEAGLLAGLPGGSPAQGQESWPGCPWRVLAPGCQLSSWHREWGLPDLRLASGWVVPSKPLVEEGSELS